jgi:hypothetical protein
MSQLLQRKQIVLALFVYALITISANFQHPITPAFLSNIGLERSLYGFYLPLWRSDYHWLPPFQAA